VPAGRIQRRIASVGPDGTRDRPTSPDNPPLATALTRSFELVAGIALFALTMTALVVVLVPSSASARIGFAVELVSLGIALVMLALLLSRRSARAVMQPLDLLDAALAAITSGDLTVRVRLDHAAAEIQYVGDSVNTMVHELARLRVIEIERTKDERVRRELSQVVHASLDLDHVVQRAVEVVGRALDVDRVHIRLRERDQGRLAAEWRRTDDIAPMRVLTPDDELYPLIHIIGVTDDRGPVVIDDANDAMRFSIEQRAAFGEAGVRAALKFPIVVGARVAGVLVATEQASPRHWSASELTLIAGFAREIGRALDHVRAFELQDEMVERLGVLDRAKNDFLAEVSRELRGPLASVLGYIELLTDASAGTVTDEQRRMLNIVERNGEQLIVLIDNLLTMSRLEAGTFEPKLAPIDLDAIVRRVCEAASPAAMEGCLYIDVELEHELALVGDEGQIERALHNLVLNAVKFTPGGGHVNVSARADGDDIVIDVRDSGIGIPIDEQDDLFARFFNAKSAPRRSTLGTGLGLYIVKQIVDGHDGEVGAVSAEGRGSTFTMRLPARPKATSLLQAVGR
jgi:two-component system, OmpR family, phosphate regulon sensor histidine kinase PhoR